MVADFNKNDIASNISASASGIGGIESSIKTLQSLGRKKPLREASDKARSEEAMRDLKRNGFTNREISTLSNGGFAEPTIKEKTRGTSVIDNHRKHDAMELLAQMVSRGLTLEQVKLALSTNAYLDSKGVTVEDVSSFAAEVKNAKIEMRSLLEDYKQTRFQTGLPLEQQRELVAFKQELEQIGFSHDVLKSQIVPAARSYRDPAEVIAAINKYGELQKLQVEVDKLKEDKVLLDASITYTRTELENLKERKAKLEAPLAALESLESKGFNEQVFFRLRELCERYGDDGGVAHVLEAVQKYNTIDEMRRQISALERMRNDEETQLNKSRAEHAHLETLIDMCHQLLDVHHFSIHAVYDLLSVARKYGPVPFDVIKAFNTYGDLQSIKKEIIELEAKKSKIESEIAELDKRLQAFAGQAEGISLFLKQAAEPITEAFATGAEQLASSYKAQIEQIKKESEEYAKQLGLCAVFEEELNMARVVSSILKFPAEAASKLSSDYAILLLDAASRFCRARAINPHVKLTLALSVKSCPVIEPPAIDLIDIARDAIKEATSP